jgi:hypothetical protein
MAVVLSRQQGRRPLHPTGAGAAFGKKSFASSQIPASTITIDGQHLPFLAGIRATFG